ncbi:MAG: aspartate kinase, monofunctional class [Anaerolineales bacterium]
MANNTKNGKKRKIAVMKFGGTSVGGADAISQAADIIADQAVKWNHLVVVVSAMSGVTDGLIACARSSVGGDEKKTQATLADLHTRHQHTIEQLLKESEERDQLRTNIDGFFDEINAFCSGIQVMGEVTQRGMDTVTSFGERMNARIFTAVLEERGVASQAVDATELIITNNHHQEANPLMEVTQAGVTERLLPLLKNKVVPVVTGFIGATEEGDITTLGRGGSDYTASILGVCLDAAEVWTWTDVDGVMTADPRLVPNAQIIPELSYEEISEMAYFGAKVLHPKTIRPIVEREIPLRVKNTFNPECPGTLINKPELVRGKISAVTSIHGLSLVTVEGRGMIGVPGIAARTFSAVAKQGASVLMISQSSSEQSICFIVPEGTAKGVIHAIEREMEIELHRRDIDRVWAQSDVVIVTVVGAGMRSTPGVSARVFGALWQANINDIAIAQGSSEHSISIVISAEDAEEAVRQIHEEVIINGQSK